MKVWLDGKIVDRDDARVSLFDAGFQHAVGLFETMLARNGRVFRPLEHMQRLANSAETLRLTETLWIDPLAEAVQRTLEANEMESARLRLMLTGGDLNMLQGSGTSRQQPTIAITCQPPTPYADALFEHGVLVTVADGRVNPLSGHAGHKTMNYWERISALQVAGASRASEALWFSVTNHLASGCVSNAFIVRDGTLVTPIARGEEVEGALRAPVLPGITRTAVMELARANRMPVETAMIDINAVTTADEVFLTNSSWGVLPVIAVEQSTIGNGHPGEVTKTLRAAWLEMIDRETKASANAAD